MANNLTNKSIDSFAWKTAQSVCSLGITFVIQLVLARMLIPEDFGIVAISTVFMTLANTVIETSFSSSVIQKSTITQKLLSSVFYTNFLLSILVYIVLFFLAPVVAMFYNEEMLVLILRIQGLRVLFSGVYSIHQAILNRKMKFKVLFFCNLIGVIVQAVSGILMAYSGMGVWALVISTCVGNVISGIFIIISEPWKPSLCFSFNLVKDAVSYSSKILVIRVLKKIFYNIRVLIIGKVYNAGILGLFNKGFQFPSTVMTIIDGSLTSVAFTHLSKLQNDKEVFLNALRRYIRIAMFLCAPAMIGMILVAEPLIYFLLTEKWSRCIPFLQIICLSQLFIPLNIKTTALEALGLSDLSMKLNTKGILISIILLVLSTPFSPLIMVFSDVLANLILQIMITFSIEKKLGYSIKEQMKDSISCTTPTIIMVISILCLEVINFKEKYLLELFIKVMVGIIFFVFGAILTKNKEFFSIANIFKQKMKEKSK